MACDYPRFLWFAKCIIAHPKAETSRENGKEGPGRTNHPPPGTHRSEQHPHRFGIMIIMEGGAGLGDMAISRPCEVEAITGLQSVRKRNRQRLVAPVMRL